MARTLVVLTGAGISADSGLATFRGNGGLWEGRRVEDVATPEAWRADPESVWRFYQWRRAALTEVAPNPAHVALAELEEQLAGTGVGFLLVTQNVDDLHDRAGSSALHMHGELALLRCEICARRTRDLTFLDPDVHLACDGCGHPRLRPDIVWFGETPYGLREIQRVLPRCTHFAALGTSGNVYPAAGFLAAVRAGGAKTWVNGLEAPENLAPTDTFLPGRAADVVPELCRELYAELTRAPA